MSMKRIIVSIIAFLTLTFGFAQTFTTEKSKSFTKESEKDVYRIVFPSAYGFMTLHHLDNVMMDNTKAMVLTKYDQSMQAMETKTFNLPKLGLRASDLQKVVELKEQLIFLSTVMDKKIAKHEVNAQVYNQKDNTVSDNKVLASIPIDGYSKSGFYQIATSPDQSKIAIIANMPFEKNTQEAVKIWVYDNQLNLLWEQSATLNYESERAYQEELFVLNSGKVIVNKITDAFKKTRQTQLLTFDGKAVETSIWSSAGFQPMNMKLVDVNGKPMMIGFFCNGKNSVVKFNSETGDDTDGAFLYDLEAQNLIGIHLWSEQLKSQDLKSVQVVDVKIINDDIFMIGEKQLTKSEFRKSGNTLTTDLDYTYTFGSSVIVNFDTKGTLKSFKYLYPSRTYLNYEKEKGSLAALYLENGLHVFSNSDNTMIYNAFFTENQNSFDKPRIIPYEHASPIVPSLIPNTVKTVKDYNIIYYMTNYRDNYWFNKTTG
jgi:hypothetical protein